jgi:AraC-like DNA-binding protein
MQGLERFSYSRGTFEDTIAGKALERRDIYDQWLSFLSRNLISYTLASDSPKESGFEIIANCRRAGGFTLARFKTVKGRSQLFRRSAEIARDGRDGYILYMPMHGNLELEQFDRKQLYQPWSVVLLSTSDHLLHAKLGDNDTLCFMMPREFVDQRIVSAENLCARPPSCSESFRRLFVDTMLAFQRDAQTLTENEFTAASRIVGELALLAVNHVPDAQSGLRSVRTCNLARVKRVIRAHLNDPELKLTDVANEASISLRYLHDLFHEDGRTAREYLIGERLRHARHMLETAADSSTTVTSVSISCGFGNSSQFSTAFRRAFGLSPRDVLRRR